MHAVRKFNNDHADILAHRNEHFAQVFRLLLFTGGERDLAELCHAVRQVCNLLTERFHNVVIRNRRVLNDVMQQTCHDGRGIHAEFHKLIRHRNGVDDVRLAGAPHLSLMRCLRELIRFFDQREVIFFFAFFDQ